MVGTRAVVVPATPLEHPYGALALLLALSGSQRWTVEEEEGGGGQEGDSEEDQSKGDALVLNKATLAGLGGESSRLWSTDSDESEGAAEGDEPSQRATFAGGLLSVTEPAQGGPDHEGGTQEWLQDFENDDASESTARTDGQ